MARIRTIKPDFFKNWRLYKAEQESGLPLRLAFESLWPIADREGRFEWIPEQLKIECLPYDDVDFSRVLDALSTRDYIVKYAENGREYGFIPSWNRHQVINNREKESVLPEPNENNILTRGARVVDASSTPLEPARGERKGKEGEGKGKGKEGETPAPSDKSLDAESEIILTIPLVDKSEYEVTENQIADWQQDYPGINVQQEVHKCRAWNIANPKNRKTRSGIMRHINAWLSRAQDKARPERGTADPREAARDRLFGGSIEGEAQRIN